MRLPLEAGKAKSARPGLAITRRKTDRCNSLYQKKKPRLWTAKGISMPVESNEFYEVKDYDHSYMLALSAIKGTGDSPTTWIPIRLRELT